jgi:hypothetical protein
VTCPGAESYRAHLQVDTPPATATVRVRLTLVGDKGESPRLTVSEGQRTLFGRKTLAVPANTPG